MVRNSTNGNRAGPADGLEAADASRQRCNNEEAGGYFMRLGSARGRRGADEWLGLSQRIPYSTEGRLVFRFRARSPAE